MYEFFLKIAQSEWFMAYEAFMASYGLYIAAFGVGFILAMVWWGIKHPEDFFVREEDDEPELWFEEIDR